MKKTIQRHLLFLLLFCFTQSWFLHAQVYNTQVQESQFTSALYNWKVTTRVYLPESYQASQQQYPVLYMLKGGNETVAKTVAALNKLAQENNIPEMIIVGIDCEAGDLHRFTYNQESKKFLSFLEQELIPFIERKYRNNKQRFLYDKSYRGSFVLYTFLSKPALFKGYLAASKEWFEQNNNYFNKMAERALQKPDKFKGRKIFLGTMNGAYNNSNIPEVDKNMQAFTEMLENKSNHAVGSQYQAYDDWDGVPNSFLADALVFVSSSTVSTGKLTMTQKSNGRWAIFDKQRKELYEVFFFDNGPDPAAEGLIRIVKNGKIGYADAKTYAVVIAPQFDCAFPFENGKAKVSNNCKTVKDGEYSIWESDHWQFVDKKGKW